MSTDIVGPANATNAVTSRPSDTRIFGPTDTWFKDCSSSSANDGTKVQSGWLNAIVGQLRSLIRANGLTGASSPIVTEDNFDDMMTRAVNHLIQRGQQGYADDTGAASALVVALTPALAEYKKGVTIRVKAAYAPTGPSTIIVNGLGLRNIVHANTGAATAAQEWIAGSILVMTDDGTQWMLTSVQEGRPTLNAARTYYVKATAPGNDANDGLSSGAPFATWQHAINVVQKLNLNGWPVTIQGLGGTYSAGATASGPFFGGGTVTIVGSGDLISVTSGSAFYATYGAELSIGADITVLSSDGANGALTAQFGGLLNIVGDTHFGACTGYHMGALDGGQVRLRAGYTTSGNAGVHLQAFRQGRFSVDTASPITPGFGAVNFSGAFARCGTLSYMLLGAYNASAASVTGQRFYVDYNSDIDVQGGGVSFLPGSTAGFADTATGGRYS